MSPFQQGGPTVRITGLTAVEVKPASCGQILVYNAGASLVFLSPANASGAADFATTAGVPIAAGTIQTFSISTARVILHSAGAVDVYITPGNGE